MNDLSLAKVFVRHLIDQATDEFYPTKVFVNSSTDQAIEWCLSSQRIC